MTEHGYNVLFFSLPGARPGHHRRALLNYWGKGRFQPSAPEPSEGRGIRWRSRFSAESCSRRRSAQQELNEFAGPGAPPLDFVFTVAITQPGRCVQSGPVSP
jgi:hypothetical protein